MAQAANKPLIQEAAYTIAIILLCLSDYFSFVQ